MAAVFKAIQPQEYLKYFLEERIRPDGRELLKARPASLNIGSITTADGSALVRIGNTAVICGIKSQLGEPQANAPKRGIININVDLPPLCSPQFKPGPPSEQAIVTTQLLMNIVKNSECLQLEDLCIVEDKVVWHLSVDLMCLDYDGNILDACLIALMAAFQNVTLPTVNVNNDNTEVDEEHRIPLNICTHPVSTTCALFDPSLIVLDPTQEEEKLAAGLICVTCLEDGSICGLLKAGGKGVMDEVLKECISLAKRRCHEINALIETALKEQGKKTLV